MIVLGDKEYKAYQFSCWNLTFLILFMMNPYFRWILPNGLFQIVFIFTTVISLIELKGSELIVSLDSYRTKVCICIFLYIVYYTLPIFHSFQGGWFLNGIIFLLILSYNTEVYIQAVIYLKKIFVIVCCFSLIIWVLHSLNIEAPYYNYIPDFRYHSTDRYRIYGLCVSLYSGNEGLIERICGLFAEPGHFGIYIGLLMAIGKFRFNTISDFILLITGILTFSTAFYGIFVIGLIYRFIDYRSGIADLKYLFILALVVLPLFMLNPKFSYLAFGRLTENKKISSITSFIDNRTNENTHTSYKSLMKSDNYLVGYGNIDNQKIQVTNWRGGIYRYGVVGISIMFLLIIVCLSNTQRKFSLSLLAISLLIMAHRIYLMYSLGIIMVIYIAANCFSFDEEYFDEFDSE